MRNTIQTRQEALEKYITEWWKNSTDEEIAEFQINERFLMCPWSVFYKAVEKWLGRPVLTHEFANPNALIKEKSRRELKRVEVR